jgi:hypothetical protein
MDTGTHTEAAPKLELPPVLELADGTRLVPAGDERPARLDGDADHAFCLADVQREAAEPFAGYVRQSPS